MGSINYTLVTGCGIPIVAPHKNVFSLSHALVVGMCLFAFATTGLSFGNFCFLSIPFSFPLTLTEHNFINEDSFIWNKPTLALR
jgi:hypothetical protein